MCGGILGINICSLYSDFSEYGIQSDISSNTAIFYGTWTGVYTGKDTRYIMSCVSAYDNKYYFAELRIHRINRNRLDR